MWAAGGDVLTPLSGTGVLCSVLLQHLKFLLSLVRLMAKGGGLLVLLLK